MPSARLGLSAAAIRNRILRFLPPAELERVLPRLEPVDLVTKSILVVPDRQVDSVYFIESGVVSIVSTMHDGSRIEVGMVGFEGMIGLPVLLGSSTSPWEGVVQVDGRALRMTAPAFRTALAELPSLMPVLLHYLDGIQSHFAQTAACNGRHAIEQRLARWLLTTFDRVDGDSFVMTQEFLATMLGVRRPGVTLAVGTLQKAGLIRHGRGMMHILDRPGLEAVSCECLDVVRQRFAWLMNDD